MKRKFQTLYIDWTLRLGINAAQKVYAQKIKSHVIKKPHNPQLAQKTIRAVLFLSVALFNSLFPPPIFSVVENESETSCEMFAL